uniref:Tudor domain-containing protein n=1 Tax=Angiostrongylus cantonensis TaxID=6313 RepID=A0A0K0DGY1_ANGCA
LKPIFLQHKEDNKNTYSFIDTQFVTTLWLIDRSKSVSKSSTSGSKNLVRDLDVSEDSKPRRRRERRERRRRGNRENKESQIEKSGMFEVVSLINTVIKGKKRERVFNATIIYVYIGVCNFAKAEEQVEKRADFRVYHQLVHRPLLDDLEQELPLIVVYKTANGSFRHYPIRRRKVGTIYYYYVDYGDPKVPAHASLDHLVRFYQVWQQPSSTRWHSHMNHQFQINAQRHPEHRDYADQFPWWEVHL